jgi:hypothetical protein
MTDRRAKRWRREHGRRAGGGVAAVGLSSEFVYERGFVTVVLRPAHPEQALAASDELMRQQNAGEITLAEASARFGRFIDDQIDAGNPYQFLGYLARGGVKILDGCGKEIGMVQPGDSMSGGPSFAPPIAERRN